MNEMSQEDLTVELEKIASRVKTLFMKLREQGVLITPDEGETKTDGIFAILTTINYRLSQIDTTLSGVNQWLGEPDPVYIPLAIGEIVALSIYAAKLRGDEAFDNFLSCMFIPTKRKEGLTRSTIKLSMGSILQAKSSFFQDSSELKRSFGLSLANAIYWIRFTHAVEKDLLFLVEQWFCKTIYSQGIVFEQSAWVNRKNDGFDLTKKEFDDPHSALNKYIANWDESGVISSDALFSFLKKMSPLEELGG